MAAPVRCDLFLRAFDGQGKAIGEQSIRFDPNGLLLADMALATVTLPPAKAIELNVRYLGGPFSGLTVAEFDDVTYMEYGNDDAGKAACGEGF